MLHKICLWCKLNQHSSALHMKAYLVLCFFFYIVVDFSLEFEAFQIAWSLVADCYTTISEVAIQYFAVPVLDEGGYIVFSTTYLLLGSFLISCKHLIAKTQWYIMSTFWRNILTNRFRFIEDVDRDRQVGKEKVENWIPYDVSAFLMWRQRRHDILKLHDKGFPNTKMHSVKWCKRCFGVLFIIWCYLLCEVYKGSVTTSVSCTKDTTFKEFQLPPSTNWFISAS